MSNIDCLCILTLSLSLLTTFQTPAVSCTGHFNCFHTHVSARLRTVHGWKSKLCTHRASLTNSYYLFLFTYLFISYDSWLIMRWSGNKPRGIRSIYLSQWHCLSIMQPVYVVCRDRGARGLWLCVIQKTSAGLTWKLHAIRFLLVLGLLLEIGCLELFF